MRRVILTFLFILLMWMTSCGTYTQMFSRADYPHNMVTFYSFLYSTIEIVIAGISIMFIPFICRMKNKKNLPYKKGKRICLWNSILVFLIPNLIGFSVIGGIGAVMFYFINKWIFVEEKQ